MEEIEVNGLSIAYSQYGSGNVTLLFIHGSYIDQTYWNDQMKYFQDEYHVITLDLAGHGMSGRERDNWSVEGLADDVIEFTKNLDLKNVILIGHSLAGSVNLYVATKYPDPIIGFIGIDNFKNAATPLPDEYDSQVISILDNLKKEFIATNEEYARMVLLTADTPEEIRQRVVQDYRNAYEPMGQAIMPEVFIMDKTEKALLPELRLKLYLINVSYMPTNMEALVEQVPNGFEVREIAGTSHYPMLESPEILNETLDQVIKQIIKYEAYKF
ncbi:Pimeloyl-ACP methyl ester carboxylesterase [Dyadobacter koreensis]|uniref:Pimeloyl-ACP methyl ester carboxylesterase n=1 Tax=Dyadobacter koreensis TaxID=408657 RepID=A0A1H6XWC4_9BACT|nr:alpha/beta hydrolase [Dyadobacter koreensis]SEJ29150.1 Pimeloyl-ACP methyl ester carboxylesterase [Dyadobacter koreensis]